MPVITTVVRQYNRVVMGATVAVCRQVLSILVKGDEDTLSRADAQFDAVKEFVDRYPIRANNPLFVFDADTRKVLAADIERAARRWESEHEFKPVPLQEADLEELRQRFREALEQNAINTKRHQRLSTVTDMPFCTDGIGDTA
jgi:hypothetical protein